MAGTSFKIVTLGCKVNQYESAYLKEALLNAGMCEALEGESPDVAIINTCTVTQKASYQSRQAIRKAARECPSGRVAAVGCDAQVFPEELSRIPGVHLVAGNRDKGRLPELLIEQTEAKGPCIVSKNFRSKLSFEPLPIKRFLDRTRAFLKIQDGCESFCSYCIVPFARGPLTSLEPSEAIRLLKSLSTEGYREVVLTGVHLGKYGADLEGEVDLKGLIRRIGNEDLPLRIRLSSIEPNEIDGELIELMASESWLCRHFHIPLQSGDDGVLKKMNRHYSAGEFSDLVETIHARMPFAAIGVDVMAGFPGEDDLAYQNTYSLIESLPVSYLHVFPFSPRKGTPAVGFSGRVTAKETKARAAALRRLGEKKRESFYRSCLGSEFLVLTEGWHSEAKGMIKGLSDNYLPVRFPSSRLMKNTQALVRVESWERDGLRGRGSF